MPFKTGPIKPGGRIPSQRSGFLKAKRFFKKLIKQMKTLNADGGMKERTIVGEGVDIFRSTSKRRIW